MITGIIQTHDILRHPWLTVQISGIIGYLRLLAKAFSPHDYQFVSVLNSATKEPGQHSSRPANVDYLPYQPPPSP